jgi:hypothetical protein
MRRIPINDFERRIMKFIVRATKLSLAAVMLVVCLSASAQNNYEVRKDKDGFLEGRNYKAGGVVVMLFVKVFPGYETLYFNYLDDVWKKQQEALMKEGIILSYRVLQANAGHKDDYNVVLITEYKNRTTMDERSAEADMITRGITGSDQKMAEAFRDREKIRKIFGGKVTREIILR